MKTPSAISLQLLGPLEVAVNGESVHPGGPKQRALLCYLVLRAGESLSIGALVEAVWGADAPDGAIRSLRTYISSLRKLFGPAADLHGEQGTYRLELRSVETDVDRFRRAAAAASNMEDPEQRRSLLADALDLWRGPFLTDIDRTWVQEESSILEWERKTVIAQWAEATIAAGQPADAIPTIERAVAEAPLDEHLCQLLMRALYGSGRQADALAAYRRLRDGLARDLGVEPGPELRHLEEQILLHEVSARGPGPRPRLPSPASDLVGRSVEIEDLLARIEQVRLLTLTGPGGVGKTRLAVEVGRRISVDADRPVYFADLSPISDDSAVDTILASSARVQPHPDSGPLASLIEYLRAGEALLIVDNCEHVAATVSRSLAKLMRSCPNVTIVATSRAPLHIDGELEWRTPSLALPDRVDTPQEELRQWPAVELLRRRAPSKFQITDANQADVVELCRSLDGLPLALEIAASRLGSMTPAEIVAALATRTQIALERPSEEHRHETLAATIGWSYELLPEEPRQLLDRLGVMSGQFVLEDVLSICRLESESAEQVRGWLSALADESLLMAETSGRYTRYKLLETIRRFALDQLGADEPDVRTRHAQHYGTLAEAEAKRLVTVEEGDAVEKLSAAHDNLRSAVGWAMEVGDVETATRIVASICDWGYFRSHYELSQWSQWVWEMATPDVAGWRGACGSAARGAWIEGRFVDALRYAGAATTSGYVIGLAAHPEDTLADVALYTGDAAGALEHYSEVEAAARGSEDRIREAWAGCYVALTNAVLQRIPEASDAASRALINARKTGNPTLLSFALYSNGLAAKHQAPVEAIALFDEAVRMAESVGNDWFGGIARMELASTKTGHGNLESGFQDFADVIDHWHRAGDDTQLRFAWRYLVRALADVGLPAEAAVIAGALLDEAGSVLTHPHPDMQDRLIGLLGNAEYSRLTVRGSVMSLAELVAASRDAIERAHTDQPGS